MPTTPQVEMLDFFRIRFEIFALIFAPGRLIKSYPEWNYLADQSVAKTNKSVTTLAF